MLNYNTMTKYQYLKIGFKCVQFLFILGCLLASIFVSDEREDMSINQWIITGYLMLIAIVIVVTIFVKQIYTVFPFMHRGWKLAILVLLMAAFAFGESTFSLRSILSFALMGIAIIFLVISCIFSDEDKMNEIIISREFDNQHTSETAGSQFRRKNKESKKFKEEVRISVDGNAFNKRNPDDSVDVKNDGHLF